MMKRILCILVFCVLPLIASAATKQQPTYLILSAMKLEQAPFLAAIKNAKHGSFWQIKYTTGTIAGKHVIVSRTGTGVINAAITTSILINHFHPTAVLFSGIAGGLQSNVTHNVVVIAKNVFSVNLGEYTMKKGPVFALRPPNPIRHVKSPMVFHSNARFIAAAKQLQKTSKIKIMIGKVATDQHFPSDFKYNPMLHKKGVLAVDMEDEAVAHTCWMYQVPFVIIRGISNNIFTGVPYSTQRAKVAAKNAATVTMQLLALL